MSPKIKVLPDNLINKIAAGEVVERPSSVVKELVENAIDAESTDIRVDIEQSGRRMIKVTDNGCGMPKADARTAFERHATSKIASEGDLDAIRTMGFRGEALSSIASVSQVRLLTAEQGSASGTLIEIEGGAIRNFSDAAATGGTSIEVNHLFYNTPARLKFLKSPATEFSHIIAAVSHQALAHPGIRFRLNHNRKDILDLPPSRTLRDRVFQLQGEELTENLLELSGGRDSVRVYGLVSRPGYTRADRTFQEFYVNGRFIRNPSLSHALYDAYRDLLMRDRHPAGFVLIDLDPSLVDVNVHPAKAEVRFRNQAQVHDLVRDVIREALREASPGREGGEQAAPPVSDPVDRVREAVAAFEARSSKFTVEERPYHIVSRVTRDPVLTPELGTRNSEQLFPLAQVHDSFIVAQSNEGIALIDQHAAHERVLFEKIQDQYTSGTVPVQQLLIPVQVEMGAAEAELLPEHRDELERLGLLVENFGGATFLIKAVPALITGGDYRQLLLDIVDEIKVHGKSVRVDSLRDEIMSVMACHPAIKIHRKLALPEMERLIADLFSCRMPHSCPHGRPTVIRFSMDEIRKMFRRN